MKERDQEGMEQILKNHVKKLLLEQIGHLVESDQSIHTQTSDHPNQRDIKNFATRADLLVLAHQLGADSYDFKRWDASLFDMRKKIKKEFEDLKEIPSTNPETLTKDGIEVDKAYIIYLKRIGKEKEARDLAEKAANIQSTDSEVIEMSKHALRVALAQEFIEEGSIEDAKEVVRPIQGELSSYQSMYAHGYYLYLVKHYVESGKNEELESLISQLRQSAPEMVEILEDHAKEYSKNLHPPEQEDSAIDFEKLSLDEQLQFITNLLGNENAEDGRTESLVDIFLLNIHEKTEQAPEWYDKSIGSLDFLGESEGDEADNTDDFDAGEREGDEADNADKIIDNFDALQHLRNLANALAEHGQLSLLVRCVEGFKHKTDEDEIIQVRGIDGYIPQITEEFQHMYEGDIIKFYAKAGLWSKAEKTYILYLNRYKNEKKRFYQDIFSAVYAKCLARYHSDKDKNYKEAIEIINGIDNTATKLETFAYLALQQILKDETEWKKWMSDLEDRIIEYMPEEDGFSIKDLDEESPDSDLEQEGEEDVDSPDDYYTEYDFVIRLHDFLEEDDPMLGLDLDYEDQDLIREIMNSLPSRLLSELCRTALARDDYQLFKDLFEDTRMKPDIRSELIKDIADWLLKGKELKPKYFSLEVDWFF